MEIIWTQMLVTCVTVFVSLTVTFIFNKVTGLPKEIKKQKNEAAKEKEKLEEENRIRDQRLEKLEEAIGHYPEYRQQSLTIQQQLEQANNAILLTCEKIQTDVTMNRAILETRLNSLENREKNALRAKILDAYRLYTDQNKNPRQEWSEMEHHSFFKLVEDYESLGGNDYVHETILPAMNELNVIPMQDLDGLTELYRSRKK